MGRNYYASKEDILATHKEKIELLRNLYNLYVKDELDENHYYPLFCGMTRNNRNVSPKFKFLLKSTSFMDAISDDEKLQNLFAYSEEIENAIVDFHKGIPFKNFKYRLKIDEFLASNNYLDNYNYAEYVLKTYINSEYDLTTNEYIKALNISEEQLKDCEKIISFLNPLLYEEYQNKKEVVENKKVEYINQSFEALANEIQAYQEKGLNMPRIEFFRKTPFLCFDSDLINMKIDYYQRAKLMIKDDNVRRVINEYLHKNNIFSLVVININNYLNNMTAINEYHLTDEDRQNVYSIMEYLDLVPSPFVIDQVIMNYINNQYDIDALREEFEAKKEAEKIEFEENPYVYTK